MSLSPDDFLQPLDLDSTLRSEEERALSTFAGGSVGGVNATISACLDAMQVGLSAFLVRVSFEGGNAQGTMVLKQRLEAAAKALARIRAALGRSVTLVIDPFGFAFNNDGTWGVRTNDRIDENASLHLLREVCTTMLDSGADGIVTLGRFLDEVEVVRSAAKDAVTIYSFSHNTETAAAYTYAPAGRMDTGQKILPGNLTEMLLMGLLDIWQGTSVSVVKPLENFHVATNMILLLTDDDRRESFLLSEAVDGLAGRDVRVRHVIDAMRAHPHEMQRKCSTIKIGYYAVSGTTATLPLIAEQWGLEVARARLVETWRNAKSAAGMHFAGIVDRNATAFLSGQLLGCEERPR